MYLAGIATLCVSFPPVVAEGGPELVFARTLSEQPVDYKITAICRRHMKTIEDRWKDYRTA
jgi:hypothetical protein